MATVFNPYINNWEDGFITDGDPNKVIEDTVSASDYRTKVPLADSQVQNASENPAKDAAVPNANAVASRTFHVRMRALRTRHPRRICNVATRTARTLKARHDSACVRVLPARARGQGGVTG